MRLEVGSPKYSDVGLSQPLFAIADVTDAIREIAEHIRDVLRWPNSMEANKLKFFRMGRSAKVHKRVSKTALSATRAPPVLQTPAKTVQTPSTKGPTAKRRQNLKEKAPGGAKKREGEHVLGGADYVELMMGGRRKAATEAKKLPTS